MKSSGTFSSGGGDFDLRTPNPVQVKCFAIFPKGVPEMSRFEEGDRRSDSLKNIVPPSTAVTEYKNIMLSD